MANPKGSFYTTQLYVALTAGDWASDTPSRSIRRGFLSWPELLRKFRKHRLDAHEVAEVASHTQALSLLLIRAQNTSPEALDGDQTHPAEPLTLGEECLLPEERKEEARSGYNELQKLAKNETVHLALAYYAFSLGFYSDVLQHLTSVNFEDAISPINASNVGSVSTMLSVPVSQTSGPTTGYASSLAELDHSLKDGRIWRLTELIRGKCLQGMAYESLTPKRLDDALTAYESAFLLLDQINIPKSLPSSTGQANVESFTRYRELWRWVERLLWRTAALSSKSRSLSHTHRILQIYQVQSVHWPATFRPEHRSTMAQLHLHILIKTYNPVTRVSWLNETRSIVTDYRLILTATTKFPRAGERNEKVEEFVDLCVAAWEENGASGDQTGWVLDILWWATRFTFNSQRIYRHLWRILYVSGDIELARRTLKLYVQVVSKARETGSVDESDRIWVETLVQGARMLCRIPGGIEEAREAGKLLKRAEEKVNERDNVAAANVKRAKGIWHACMALRENDPSTRPEHLRQSLAELQASLKLHPTPSTHFHLALASSRAGQTRDLSAAIASAKEAVAGSPQETRYWHLLGLLLAAVEEWKDAKYALACGAKIGDEEDNGGEELKSGANSVNDHTQDDSSNRSQSTGDPGDGFSRSLLDEYALRLPAASGLLQPLPDYPPPTRHERFEHALQLRLTQLALIEHVDGPENAGTKWLEVFSWVAARKGLGEERRPPSVEPPSEHPSELLRSVPIQPLTLSHSQPRVNGSVDIPINLVPPSPTPSARPGEEFSEAQEQNVFQEKDGHRGKKMQQILKDRVHKGQAHIHTISRKIGGRNGLRIKRTTSMPDFMVELNNSKPYQASSIHSRQRLSMNLVRQNSPEPPPPPASPKKQPSIIAGRSAREKRLLSNLWLTSAATFRRQGKIEQAKAAIQEAEVADEDNADVWVQLGLYHAALGQPEKAIASYHKALVLNPDHIPAFIHLTQEYLKTERVSSPAGCSSETPPQENIDLAAGLLSGLTRGAGWDVPEAWYFLARANKLQGRLDRERECLNFALALAQERGVREITSAVGTCL
ncbi:hypothetical protein M422DRAFT_45616 [Sphaerobolus stellatus SS14]|uniref:TPR-like protein n=1 Tax=Sphaerobolus stellatus (strain SS14) TaxID=990650 RepID=A0A0C9VIW3_SPHS4|nr:hypothetical protein M422DRAFT_45616 [Sphaerobolus stellatus SS14]